MSDARLLLKQARLEKKRNVLDSQWAKPASNGKIFCTLCKETIKNANLWKEHLKSSAHLKRPREEEEGEEEEEKDKKLKPTASQMLPLDFFDDRSAVPSDVKLDKNRLKELDKEIKEFEMQIEKEQPEVERQVLAKEMSLLDHLDRLDQEEQSELLKRVEKLKQERQNYIKQDNNYMEYDQDEESDEDDWRAKK